MNENQQVSPEAMQAIMAMQPQQNQQLSEQMIPEQPQQIPQAEEQKNIPAELRKLMNEVNIADRLDGDLLYKISSEVISGTQEDEHSRSEWMDKMEMAVDCAKLTVDKKDTPWSGAANTKYPLITSASIEMNSVMYGEVIQGDKVVKSVVEGEDPAGKKQDQANRCTNLINAQMLDEQNEWERDTDKLFMVWSIYGVAFKKTFYDSIKKMWQSILCVPSNIIVNNNIKSLKQAQRITHKFELSTNEIIERMRAGIYKEYDINELLGIDEDSDGDYQQQVACKMHEIEEQHTFLDLDDDGYKEPYVITVLKDEEKVLRVVARFDEESIVMDDNKFIGINPIQYFTDYHFIPSPDGTYYSIGFGELLLHQNMVINSSINNLIDSATLYNQQSGFVGSGARLPSDNYKVKMGEWMKVKVRNGTTLSQNILPLPVHEPSQTLFQLLGFMVEMGQKASSITSLLKGETMPANAPVGTTMAMIDQGIKVYAAIVKRLYLSLKSEVEKISNINKKHITEMKDYEKWINVSKIIQPQDFENDFNIVPVIDPSVSTQMHKNMRAQALMQLLESPVGQLLNPQKIVINYIKSLRIDNPEEFLAPPTSPKPNPEIMIAEKTLQQRDVELQIKKEEADTKKMKVTMDAHNQQTTHAINVHGQMMDGVVQGHKLVENEEEIGVKKLEAQAKMEEQNRKAIKDLKEAEERMEEKRSPEVQIDIQR